MEDLFGHDPDDTGEAQPLREREETVLTPAERAAARKESRPLADRLRPSTLAGFLGQEKLVGEGAPLLQLIRGDRVPSMILWGPPGSGKTTLALLIARETKADFVTLSAVTAGVKDVRAVIDQAKINRQYAHRTILFVDEIHRFNKAQQDGFLPHVESGLITLIGATTENPSFSVVAPLLSRCRVFVLQSLTEDTLRALLAHAVEELNRDELQPTLSMDADAATAIVQLSDGDARRALGLLEVASHLARTGAEGPAAITREAILAVSQRTLMYDRAGEEHYNLISAVHKTMRSSDPQAAVYWAGRMLAAGEDPLFLLRRLIRFASEDIGLADPNALVHAVACFHAFQHLGQPEGNIFVYQLVTYLACAPKSNSIYAAEGAVQAEIQATGTLPVPMVIRNAPTRLMKDLGYGSGYTYDHDAPGHFSPKQGLPEGVRSSRFYEPSDQGVEQRIAERLRQWDEKRRSS